MGKLLHSNGNGFANGIDFIIKGRLPMGFEGWVSYGFINTKRKWLDYEKLTKSDFDITHNLTISTANQISDKVKRCFGDKKLALS